MTHVESFHAAASISREQIYQGNDDQMPISNQSDARTPHLGYIGPHYDKGGTLLLGINPGGGRDTHVRSPLDDLSLPAIRNFLNAAALERDAAFQRMCKTYLYCAQQWNLWTVLGVAIEASGRRPSEVSYLNAFPYRTRGDKMPRAAALRRCWELAIKPLLEDLQPNQIISIGKKVGKVVDSHYTGNARHIIIPRVIGDRYISEEAKRTIRELRLATSGQSMGSKASAALAH